MLRKLLILCGLLILSNSASAAKKGCLLALRFSPTDFGVSSIVPHVSGPKNNRVDFGRWASSHTNYALAMFRRGMPAEQILRKLGDARKKLNIANKDESSETYGTLVFELPFAMDNPTPRVVRFGNLYQSERNLPAVKLRVERNPSITLSWPDNSASLSREDWLNRVLSQYSLGKAEEVRPHASSSASPALYAFSKHAIFLNGKKFRDAWFKIDLDQGMVDSGIYMAPESKQAFEEICAFVDKVIRNGPLKKGEDPRKHPLVLELIHAEKLYSVAMPFSHGGNAIGQVFWSAVWSHLLGRKHVVSLDQEIFADTSFIDQYVAERLKYLDGFLPN